MTALTNAYKVLHFPVFEKTISPTLKIEYARATDFFFESWRQKFKRPLPESPSVYAISVLPQRMTYSHPQQAPLYEWYFPGVKTRATPCPIVGYCYQCWKLVKTDLRGGPAVLFRRPVGQEHWTHAAVVCYTCAAIAMRRVIYEKDATIHVHWMKDHPNEILHDESYFHADAAKAVYKSSLKCIIPSIYK